MARQSDDIAKLAFKMSLVATLVVTIFSWGALSVLKRLPPIPQISAMLAFIDETRSHGLLGEASEHLQPSRGLGSGVVVNTEPNDGSLILFTGFFEGQDQARLVRRDGSVVRKWSLDYLIDFPNPKRRPCQLESSLDVDVHGATINRHGELVVSYEYCGTVKYNACGKRLWTINEKTNHTVVPAEKGGYWLIGRKEWRSGTYPNRFPPFSKPGSNDVIHEDTLIRAGEDGRIVEQISIPKILRDGGLEAYLTGDGIFYGPTIKSTRTEIVHANKVAELPAGISDKFPMFSPGDLAISLRAQNLIIVIDPVTRAIKWHQTGPWIRQHDPEFRPDGRISVFNNNVYETQYIDSKIQLSSPRVSNIMLVDPATHETKVIYGGKKGQEMLSVVRGQHEVLPGGGMLITEFDGGRVFEVDANGNMKWEFVNKFDNRNVGEMTSAYLLKADYFDVNWNTCM